MIGATSASNLAQVEAQPAMPLAGAVPAAEHSKSKARRRSSSFATRIALVFLVLLHVAVVVGPMVFRASPEDVDPINQFAAPSLEHPLGTDEAGRDVLARVFQGGRVSLGIGFAAMLVAVVLGTLVGSVSGYFGGGIDSALMRLTDGMLALPTFFLLLVIAALFGSSAPMLVAVIGLTGWMGVARIIRSEFLRWRGREFVEAAYCLGASHTRIMLWHLLPQSVPSLSVAASIGVSVAILTESGLSYLGLGIPPPAASWGNLLLNAQMYMYRDPLLAIYPGVLILLVVLAYNFLGDGIREWLDPEMSRA